PPCRAALPAAAEEACGDPLLRISSRYVCSSTSKYAWIGSSATTVVSNVELSTRLPAVTTARETLPSIGAVTRVNDRSSLAASSAASTDASAASATSASASSCSYSSRDVAFSASRRSARSRYARASSSCAFARSRSAVSRATSASNGRESIVNNRSPRDTRPPSSKCTDSTKPPTRGRISTWLAASSRPVKSAQSRSSRTATSAAVTAGGGGAEEDCWASPLVQPARTAAASTDGIRDATDCDLIGNPLFVLRLESVQMQRR